MYLWTYWGSGSRRYFYPDYLVASINVKDQKITITPNITGKNDGNLGKNPAPNNPTPTNPVPTPPPYSNSGTGSSVPQTSDETPLMLLAALMTMSLAGAVVFARRKKA